MQPVKGLMHAVAWVSVGFTLLHLVRTCRRMAAPWIDAKHCLRSLLTHARFQLRVLCRAAPC